MPEARIPRTSAQQYADIRAAEFLCKFCGRMAPLVDVLNGRCCRQAAYEESEPGLD